MKWIPFCAGMELTDIALAATADAMASVLLEQVCDALEAELRTAQQAEGRYLTGVLRRAMATARWNSMMRSAVPRTRRGAVALL